MKYTHNKEYNEKVENDLRIIKEILIEETNPISIILFGGFGKGEGSVQKIKNKVVPLNDYDIYLITKNKLNEKQLDELGIKCSKAIGKGGLEYSSYPTTKYDENRFFHVDIRCIRYRHLNKLLPTQRTYELKFSKIIYGEDVLNKIPDVTIPVSDAIRLLFNKMHHLLLSKDTNKKFKLIHISKAFLDCCTALLIYKNNMNPTYTGRNFIFQRTDFPKELKSKVNWATKIKVNPDFNIKNIDKLWNDARDWVFYSLRYILSNNYNVRLETTEDVADFIYKKLPFYYFIPYTKTRYLFPLQYYLNILYFIRGIKNNKFLIRPLLSWRDVGLKLPIPIMFYIHNDKANCERYLRKITNKTEPLKERILSLYGLYYEQKLI